MFTYGLEYELQLVIKIPAEMLKMYPSLDKFITITLYYSGQSIKRWKDINIYGDKVAQVPMNIPRYLRDILSIDVGNLELITQYPRSSIKEAVEDCNRNLNRLIIPYLINKYNDIFEFGLFTPQTDMGVEDEGLFIECTKHLNIVGPPNELFELAYGIYLDNIGYFSTPNLKFNGVDNLHRRNICFKPVLKKDREDYCILPFLGMKHLYLCGYNQRKYYSKQARLHIKLPYRFNRYDNLLKGIYCLPNLKDIGKEDWNQSKIVGRSKEHYNWKHYNDLV